MIFTKGHQATRAESMAKEIYRKRLTKQYFKNVPSWASKYDHNNADYREPYPPQQSVCLFEFAYQRSEITSNLFDFIKSNDSLSKIYILFFLSYLFSFLFCGKWPKVYSKSNQLSWLFLAIWFFLIFNFFPKFCNSFQEVINFFFHISKSNWWFYFNCFHFYPPKDTQCNWYSKCFVLPGV